MREVWKNIMAFIMACLLTGLCVFGPGLSPLLLAQTAAPTPPAGQTVTPQSIYTDPQAKQLAANCQAMNERVAAAVKNKFKPELFHLFVTPETTVGGVGMWVNPARFGQPSRYLGVFCMMQLLENPFRDDQAGHLAAVIDRFGKDILAIQTNELKTVKDPLINGAALVFIFSKEPLNSPSFLATSEAFALFISNNDLTMFTTFRLTLQKLIDQNDLFLFQGEPAAKTLQQYFIQP